MTSYEEWFLFVNGNYFLLESLISYFYHLWFKRLSSKLFFCDLVTHSLKI